MTTAQRQQNYEAMIIFSPLLSEADAKKVIDGLRDEVTEASGEVTFEDFWGKRKLAYPIKKEEEGYYHVFLFSAPTDFIRNFDKDLRLNKNVLRHLISVTPKNYTPITGAEVLAKEDEHFQGIRLKKSGQKRSMYKKKPILVEGEVAVAPTENKDEDRNKKLDKMLSNDLNI
jgi:small subunit ribosomal protein S6